MRRIITYNWLKENACPEKVEIFKKVFGDRVELTRESLLKAAKTKQNPSYLVCFLGRRQQLKYSTIMEKDHQLWIHNKMKDIKYQTKAANTIADILKL